MRLALHCVDNTILLEAPLVIERIARMHLHLTLLAHIQELTPMPALKIGGSTKAVVLWKLHDGLHCEEIDEGYAHVRTHGDHVS